MSEMQDWRKERNRALAALDIEWGRQLVPAGTSDEVILIALHKARYDCTDIAAEQRHQSGDWLRQHGYRRMDGTELLPEGELPV